MTIDEFIKNLPKHTFTRWRVYYEYESENDEGDINTVEDYATFLNEDKAKAFALEGKEDNGYENIQIYAQPPRDSDLGWDDITDEVATEWGL